MKVAIAKDGDFVSEHFGHCNEYALFVVENSKITLTGDSCEPRARAGKTAGTACRA